MTRLLGTQILSSLKGPALQGTFPCQGPQNLLVVTPWLAGWEDSWEGQDLAVVRAILWSPAALGPFLAPLFML